MTEWSLGVTIAVPASAVVDDAAAALAEELSGYAPAIAASREALSVRVALTGDDVGEVTTRGLSELRAALEHIGWPSQIRALDVTEWSFFEDSLDEPT